ncbi:hypothetical protein BS78_06G167700, partial [Paspalum vaginatum]
MAERFFPNGMSGYVEDSSSSAPCLHALLSLPYPALADRFLRAALQLKQRATDCIAPPSITGFARSLCTRRGRRSSIEPRGTSTLHRGGALGTAFLLFRAFLVTGDHADLATCAKIVSACDAASAGVEQVLVTFICGRAGVSSLGVVVAKHTGYEDALSRYLSSFKQITVKFPDELLYGKAGYLWACSFLNKHVGKNMIEPTTTDMIIREAIKDGRRLSTESCPLMYEWYGEKYWGAAHGLAGIMHVLLDMDLAENEREYVKGTLCYPWTEGDNYDCLVHWCHRAPRISLTLTKASEVCSEETFLDAASDAAEVIWNRGLLKRVGICHGISGNAKAFLSLYRLTKEKEYLYRAKVLACFLLDQANKLIAQGIMHGGDEPCSLFEGQAGMAYLFLDMMCQLT